MFKRILIGVLALAAVSLSTGCSTKVPNGNVGVLFNLYGQDKGVSEQKVGPGRYWLTVNEELYLFPTFKQTVQYDAAGQYNQEIVFQDKDGTQLAADVGIQYFVPEENVLKIFKNFRMGNEELSDRVLYRIVRDAMVQEGSTRSVEEVYGPGKAKFLESVSKTVKTKATEIGVTVEEVSLLGAIRLPENILNSLNAKVAATQKAQQRENEVAQAKAEADKKIEEARGEAESLRLKRSQITPELIRLKELEVQEKAIEKWSGQMPSVTGGAMPFINVSPK